MQLSNEFKIHCSCIGQIMTDAREKGKLSTTCLGFVEDWIKSQPEFYGRSVQFKSKYTMKGNECEAESIKFAAKVLGWGDVKKNTEYKSNDYLIGCADVLLPISVEDLKNSWSHDTFPLFETKIPVKGYDWQLRGYMELYDKPKAGLVFTLMDAPERMIDKEARYKAYELGIEEVEFDLWQSIKESMTYSNFRDELRIKRFEIVRDRGAMIHVQNRVEQIRKHIESL